MPITRPELDAALNDLERRLKIKGAAGLVILGAFLTALKFFG